MTEKQENILKAALELFAEEGYNATSTSKVAKKAGVSEGLIFRHFGNKEGLLNAILLEGTERAKMLFADIVLETDPKKVIRKSIELPFNVAETEYNFWRLQFKLKWELKKYSGEKMEPLVMALANAFEKLDYESPKLEAEFIVYYIDGVGGAILRNVLKNKAEMKNFLLKKYNL